MRNAFAAVLVIFAIPAVALPPVVGRMAESAFMAQAEESPFADVLEVEVVEYDRGLYRSQAVLRFGLDSAYVEALRAAAEVEEGAEAGVIVEEAGEVTFRVVADLVHGPVGFSRGPFLGLAKGVMRPELEGGRAGELGERWRQRLDVPWLFEVRHRLRFGGSARFDVVLPEIDYQGDDGSALTVEGWDAWAEYDPDDRHLAGEAAIDVVEVASVDANLRVESVSAEGEGTILGPSIMDGDGAIRIERFSLLQATDDVRTTDMVGLALTWVTELTEDGSALDSRFGYAVDSLLVDDRALRNAELVMAVRNVDRDAAERWAGLTQTAWTGTAGAGSEAMEAQMGGLMHDFLKRGPELEVHPARFTFDGESFQARIRVAADPSALPAREAFDPFAAGSLSLWSSLFSAEAEIEVAQGLARTLVAESQATTLRAQMAQMGRSLSDEEVRRMAREQAGMLLEMLVEAGYVTEEGDGYRSRLLYEGGRLTANGQPLALPGR